MVKAPVGSGKTTWALSHLSKELDSPLDMIYLIDTQNGRDQIVSANSDIAAHYSDTWLDKVMNGWEMFSEDPKEDKVVVMTYAKFGAIVLKHMITMRFPIHPVHILRRYKSLVYQKEMKSLIYLVKNMR